MWTQPQVVTETVKRRTEHEELPTRSPPLNKTVRISALSGVPSSLKNFQCGAEFQRRTEGFCHMEAERWSGKDKAGGVMGEKKR
ncbi:uncharacterized [Tachysurus ichikawai]